jgi:uncharacterized protein (TIGR03663 family)
MSRFSVGTVLFAACILAVTAGALAVRTARLDLRPMHADEAAQADKTGILLETGRLEYDPQQHHGPTLYWFTLPSLWLSGVKDFALSTEAQFRVVPAVFGAGLLLLMLLLADGLGHGPVLLAAVLTAISPAMVFYSRYYVQETLLVFFTLAALASAWRYARSGALGWAVAAGASFGLMHATKETWVLAAVAMALALPLAIAWGRRVAGAESEVAGAGPGVAGAGSGVAGAGSGVAGAERSDAPGILSLLKPHLRPLPLVAAAATACLVATALYSSFGTHGQGPLDSLRAYGTYLRRGTETGPHTHPWYFYFELLIAFRPARGFFWTEGLIVALAAVGCFHSLSLWERAGFVDSLSPWERAGVRAGRLGARSKSFCRFLAFYTALLTAFYSLIPYKTPWCMLSFLHGMILLAGVGAWAIVGWLPGLALKLLAAGLLAAGAAHLGWECRQLNFDPRLVADQRNPYVYAHTSTDVLNLAARMERLAQLSDEGHAMVIHVVSAENYSPLPWYLRKFKAGHVGYWHDPATWAEDAARYPPPSVILLTSDVQEAIDAHLRVAYNRQIAYNRQMMFGLRPEVFVSAYVREDLWEKFLAASASPTR